MVSGTVSVKVLPEKQNQKDIKERERDRFIARLTCRAAEAS